jgi:hypothetical protein
VWIGHACLTAGFLQLPLTLCSDAAAAFAWTLASISLTTKELALIDPVVWDVFPTSVEIPLVEPYDRVRKGIRTKVGLASYLRCFGG